ncbi:hypothetical protein LPB41_14015 [Thalassospira sp. MA62]|nr:hypothetical protein [Thalassospira sp. MA62]
MSYPHTPYGYEPTHCPVIPLMPCRTRGSEPVEGDRHNDDTSKDGRHIGLPFGALKSGNIKAEDIDSMIEYIVTTRQGWRASLVMRSFLRWWREPAFGLDHADGKTSDQTPMMERKISDAVIMLLALNQGREGFVHGYLSDINGNDPASRNPHDNDPVQDREKLFNKGIGIAVLALALSPLVLVLAVLLFVQVDDLISTGTGKLFGYSYDLLFFVGSFGAIGALTSMMMRLGKGIPWQEMEPMSVFFNFLFRPCMGFCFALLVLLAVRGGILPIPLDELGKLDDLEDVINTQVGGQQLSIVLVLAFLSGFSERLSSSFIQRFEGRFARNN